MKEITIKIKDLRFNLENPRHPIMDTQEECYEYLFIHENILELAQYILKHSYIPVRKLLVIEENSFYTVCDGNRRLAALKYLLYKDKWSDNYELETILFDDYEDALPWMWRNNTNEFFLDRDISS